MIISWFENNRNCIRSTKTSRQYARSWRLPSGYNVPFGNGNRFSFLSLWSVKPNKRWDTGSGTAKQLECRKYGVLIYSTVKIRFALVFGGDVTRTPGGRKKLKLSSSRNLRRHCHVSDFLLNKKAVLFLFGWRLFPRSIFLHRQKMAEISHRFCFGRRQASTSRTKT